MKYELASSSTEEGEVKKSSFPYNKSYIQYYYYPQTTRFVGKNTVPHIMNYRNEGICQRLKKEIKAEYPQISFTFLDDNKLFFDNKFSFVSEITPMSVKVSLVDVKQNYKRIEQPLRRESGESKYEKFFHNVFFNKEEAQKLEADKYSRVFALEDKVLESLDNTNSYIFFRVTVEKHRSHLKYVFEDVFYLYATFYEYLDIFAEVLVRSHGSEEIRRYESDNTLFLIYSSTVFKDGNFIRRLYGSVDTEKNTKVIFNKGSCNFHTIQGKSNQNIKWIAGLDLPEGDYVINSKKVYKLSTEGEVFVFKGILYEDFKRTVFKS
ncbi:hypothetical protein GINT2_001708 [Glugoides intestinalis]